MWPHWFNLSDEGCEDVLYDVPVFREFCRFDLGRERIPDATTLLNFRHLLEEYTLDAVLFATVSELLLANGMSRNGLKKLSGDTLVNATLIAVPPSTKNQEKCRDPLQKRIQKMHQIRQCNEWRFGIKPHIGTDSRTGLIHSASVTATNVHDWNPHLNNHQVPNLLHSEETRFYGDSAYRGR